MFEAWKLILSTGVQGECQLGHRGKYVLPIVARSWVSDVRRLHVYEAGSSLGKCTTLTYLQLARTNACHRPCPSSASSR